jgi:hypothetical protein
MGNPNRFGGAVRRMLQLDSTSYRVHAFRIRLIGVISTVASRGPGGRTTITMGADGRCTRCQSTGKENSVPAGPVGSSRARQRKPMAMS